MSRRTRRSAALVPVTAAALLLGTAGSAFAIPNHDQNDPPPPPPNAAPTARLSVTPNPALVSSPPILVNAKIAKAPVLSDAVLGRNAVTFDASRSSDPDGTIARYQWDLDGQPGFERTTTTPKVSRTYAERALITVRVKVTDDGGKSDDAIQVLRIHRAPRAALAATPADITVGGTTTLSAAGSTDDDGIAKYEWDFDGNGTYEQTTAIAAAQTTYATVGERTARVRVTDTLGASSVASTRVGVHAAPNAVYTATPSPAVAGEQVAFDGSDSLVAEPVVRFEWDLDGNGTFETDTGASPKAARAYATPGTVATRLRITDRQGSQDVETRNVVVLAQPPVDRTAPLVRVSALSSRLSPTGRVALTVACPAGERLCTGRLALKTRGASSAAVGSRTFTVGGGQRQTVRVLLSSSARKTVKRRGKLAVRITAAARDAAGNRGTTTRTLTVRKAR